MQALNIDGKLLSLKKPLVMGILNITDDSFYDGGNYFELSRALKQIRKMIDEGAEIIDIGAFSSRPGAELIDPATQLERLLPILNVVATDFPDIPLSIDTYSAQVVETLAKIKRFIVNDISCFSYDDRLLDVVADLQLPYVLMHSRGLPKSMKDLADYEDVTQTVLTTLAEKLHLVRNKGINDIILDPGFGFAKSTKHNFELLSKLQVFNILEAPVLVGLSRKSMIYKTLNISPKEALNGTTALHMTALMNGAQILRVHDVKEAVETRNLWLQLRSPVNN